MKSPFSVFLPIFVLFLVVCRAEAATYHVPDDYISIQEAVDSVSNGDTVIVRAGIYFETIDFRGKAITLKSECGPQNTSIDGGSSGSVFTFRNGEENSSVVDGFTITNGSGTSYISQLTGGGFFCLGSSPCLKNNIISQNFAANGSAVACVEAAAPLIDNNRIDNNSAGSTGAVYGIGSSPVITGNEICANMGSGIFLEDSDNCIISGNDVSLNGRCGIRIIGEELLPVTGYLVTMNTVSSNSEHGILLHHVNDSTFTDNTACFNLCTQGIFVCYSDGNHFAGNTCSNNSRQGIALGYSDNNTVTENTCNSNLDDGIPVCYSRNNVVTDNTCNGNVMHGVHLKDSSDCLVSGNSFSGNKGGIQIRTSCNNTICNNASSANNYGIRVHDNSHGNSFYHNLFDNPEYNVRDECGSNLWDAGYPKGGNYWGDYTGLDLFSGPDQDLPGPDGIGDTTYNIPTVDSQDCYPLMIPVGTEIVIDNSDPAFTILTGEWVEVSIEGAINGSALYAAPGAGHRKAGWEFSPASTPGTYGVYTHVISHDWMHLMSCMAPHRLHHKNGHSDWINVDQSTSGTIWVHLGDCCFDCNGCQGILLSNCQYGYVLADAVKLVYLSP